MDRSIKMYPHIMMDSDQVCLLNYCIRCLASWYKECTNAWLVDSSYIYDNK